MSEIQTLEKNSMLATQRRLQSYEDLVKIDIGYKDSGEIHFFLYSTMKTRI